MLCWVADSDLANVKIYFVTQLNKVGLDWTIRSSELPLITLWRMRFGRNKVQMGMQFTAHLKVQYVTSKSTLSTLHAGKIVFCGLVLTCLLENVS